MRLKVFFVLLLLSASIMGFGRCAYAATYSLFLGDFYSNYGNTSYCISSINLIGFNETQGFAKILPADVTMNYSSGNGGRYRTDLNYTLPDDGSYWKVQGSVVFSVIGSGSPEGGTAYSYIFYKIDTANSTPGSFTGYSPKTATDSSNIAANNAITAATNATNAYNAANAAKNSADSAASYSWDTLSSKSVATLSREANVKLDSLQNSITNIQNNLGGDTVPPAVKLRTVSGAMATSGNYIQAVVDVADNLSDSFTYSLNGTSYQPLPSDGIISLPLFSSGSNLIGVWVKDEAGNSSRASITIRKL